MSSRARRPGEAYAVYRTNLEIEKRIEKRKRRGLSQPNKTEGGESDNGQEGKAEGRKERR